MTTSATASQGIGSQEQKIYMTLSGLPLTFHLEWPFRKSTSGTDFWVLHGDVGLAGPEGLHAPVAVNLSATLREVMPSLDPEHAEAPVIAAVRKEVDRRQLEFVKSGKLVPVHFSSRHYDFKRNKWVFGKAGEEALAAFLEQKVYWQTRAGVTRIWIADQAEALYLETSTEHLLEIAGKLGSRGLVRLEKENAIATAALMAQSERFERERRDALKELEKKHEFERG